MRDRGKGPGPRYFFETGEPVSRLRTALPGRKIALFLDFDGTLSPIQKDPARCVPADEMREQLQLLASLTSGNLSFSACFGVIFIMGQRYFRGFAYGNILVCQFAPPLSTYAPALI